MDIFTDGLQPFVPTKYAVLFDPKTDQDNLFEMTVNSEILTHKIAIIGVNEAAMKNTVKRYPLLVFAVFLLIYFWPFLKFDLT
jgi:hypothetical protein